MVRIELAHGRESMAFVATHLSARSREARPRTKRVAADPPRPKEAASASASGRAATAAGRGRGSRGRVGGGGDVPGSNPGGDGEDGGTEGRVSGEDGSAEEPPAESARRVRGDCLQGSRGFDPPPGAPGLVGELVGRSTTRSMTAPARRPAERLQRRLIRRIRRDVPGIGLGQLSPKLEISCRRLARRSRRRRR